MKFARRMTQFTYKDMPFPPHCHFPRPPRVTHRILHCDKIPRNQQYLVAEMSSKGNFQASRISSHPLATTWMENYLILHLGPHQHFHEGTMSKTKKINNTTRGMTAQMRRSKVLPPKAVAISTPGHGITAMSTISTTTTTFSIARTEISAIHSRILISHQFPSMNTKNPMTKSSKC